MIRPTICFRLISRECLIFIYDSLLKDKKTNNFFKGRPRTTKMLCLQQCGAQDVIGKTKWTFINISKSQSTDRKRWCCASDRNGKALFFYKFLPQNQTSNSDKYSSQIDWLKKAIDEKRLELSNRKCVVFHQHNTRLHDSFQTLQTNSLNDTISNEWLSPPVHSNRRHVWKAIESTDHFPNNF